MINLEGYPTKFWARLMKYPQDKRCVVCGTAMHPKMTMHWNQGKKRPRLEALNAYTERETCSHTCTVQFLDNQRTDTGSRIGQVESLLKQFRSVDPHSPYVRYAEQRLRDLGA